MVMTEVSDLLTGAVFDDTGKYRYMLWRVWNYPAARDGNARMVMFILGNPSTAGKYTDDPTTCKCAHFAQKWHYDGMYIGELYAIVGTHWVEAYGKPKEPDIPRLVGPECDYYLGKMKCSSALHVAGWGFLGDVDKERTKMVTAMFPELMCFGVSKSGQPKHPLYLPANAVFQQFTPVAP